MPELAASLEIEADLDLSDLFATVASAVLGVDFGDTVFDPSSLLERVAAASSPELGTLTATVTGTVSAGELRLTGGLAGATLPAGLTDVVARLGSLELLTPDLGVPDLPDLTGLDGLELRLDALLGAVESGPLADLLSLAPGLSWPEALGRLGGGLAGALELLRVLAGLLGTATGSRHLVDATARFAALLDRESAQDAATYLLQVTRDLDLAPALRAADPTDVVLAEELAARVSAFVSGVGLVGDVWSAGMGYGEAALPFLDVTGTAAGLELARLALTGADLAAVAQLAADVRRIGAPLLDLPLPDPAAFHPGFVASTLSLVTDLTARVEAWDVAATLAPVAGAADVVLTPMRLFQEAVAGVEGQVTGALQSLRGVLDEIDLTPVQAAVEATVRPVTELLDAVADEIAAAQATLTEVATAISTALSEVSGVVSGAAGDVEVALSAVDAALTALKLDELGETLSAALRTVAAALGSAQLSPYFDTAIEVISTAADVIDAVPFGLLPTDVQTEIVEACKPIKALDLQEVEDALRAELAAARGELNGDVLVDIEAAYGEMLAFLQSLDPAPHLAQLEEGPFAELRAGLDAVDPVALLAPVDAALAEIRALLDAVDLERDVLSPLRGLVQPVLDAIDELDPGQLLAPLQEEVDAVRESLSDTLHLEAASEALLVFRERGAELLDRIDPEGVAEVLGAQTVTALATLPDGPPGGALGAVLVSVAEASGLRADEPAVQDVLDWVSGDADGATVVRERVGLAARTLASVHETVSVLDPAPLVAAASAYRRTLVDAVGAHPSDSALRTAIGPLLAGRSPAEVLGGLGENRRRYLLALDVERRVMTELTVSGRSEVTASASGLQAAIAPLGAFPARLRAVLAAVGLDPDGQSLRTVLLGLLADAGPAGLTAALVELVTACRGQVLNALDVVVDSGHEVATTVQGLLYLLDLGPIVAELTALQQAVHDEVAHLSPDALLGEVVAEAEAVIDRLRAFDPLGPVRDVVTAAMTAADEVFESARPTVVFAPVVDLHHRVVALAGGLDVVVLLRPVLEALDGLAGQLDDGFDRTGEALQELQDALPSEVTSSDFAGSASVDLGVSF